MAGTAKCAHFAAIQRPCMCVPALYRAHIRVEQVQDFHLSYYGPYMHDSSTFPVVNKIEFLIINLTVLKG